MNPSIADIVVHDFGPGTRLGTQARDALRAELKSTRGQEPGCVLVTVEESAWDHAPEVTSYRPGDWAQAEVADQFQALAGQLYGLGRPVVAVLDGPVSGFGLALAMAADLRVATARTTFSMGRPETAATLLGGSSWLLTGALGTATVAHLAWTGDVLTSEECRYRGLLSEVLDDTSQARLLAGRLASLPTGSSSALKRALKSRQRGDLEASMDYDSWLAGISAGVTS